LIIGLMNAAVCQFNADRYTETCKNTYHVLKIDPFNLEAIYYYGRSKLKLGNVKEAARVFLLAKKAPDSAHNQELKQRVLTHLDAILAVHKEIDIKLLEASIDHLLPEKHVTSNKKAYIYAAVAAVPTTLAVYYFSKHLKMSQKKRLLTSISSGILVGAFSFLLEKLTN